MKTTLNINDELLVSAKAAALQKRTTPTCLIEEGLNLPLRALSASPPRTKFRLPVLKGTGGLVKGVNQLSNKAMLAAAEDDA